MGEAPPKPHNYGVYMSGEYAKATEAIDAILAEAEANPSMSKASMCNTMLGILLQKQAQHQSKADIANFVQFQLDNMGEDELVITRGC